MNFDGISFKGKFREYQQSVLDNSSKYLSDKKINIVAAPGSGKTILGLELIRRLNSPCIILSPTTIIRQQWGQRFEDSFLNDKSKINDYFSYDLNKISLINSITYQALYSVVNKIPVSSEDEVIDYSNIELFQLMKSEGIKTICLDEAHHLQNEWQKALEKFIKGLEKNVTVISLTATPPYDSNPSEWSRYISTCGEIDDEIFVPELVKEKTLCAHQDFVIFNYPSKEETDDFKKQYSNSFAAIDEICRLPFVSSMNETLERLFKTDDRYIYSNFAEVVAVLILLTYGGHKINKRIFYKLTNSKIVPSLNKKYAERAVNFLLSGDLTSDENKKAIVEILKKWSLLERNKAIFDLSERQKRELVSSIGKLSSIKKIVSHELEHLKDDLRMLILTDYIKKEGLFNIGKDIIFDNISIVSIFETIRRDNPDAKIACLSGSLVILSEDLVNDLSHDEKMSKKIKCTQFENTHFFNVSFKGQNREKVAIVSHLFERGKINILIGTQSLLGEGWDSPCINSLILASYVGSFMLSNQMRGRAIRTYKKDPNKTANIWHLVTIEPEYLFEDNKIKNFFMQLSEDKRHIHSFDYATLQRRFDCFVGPNYDTGDIESGIERITAIKPPYSKENIDRTNQAMFDKSNEREKLREEWDRAIDVSAKTNIVAEVPKECRVPAFTYRNMLGLIIGTAITAGVFSGLNPLIRVLADPNVDSLVFILAFLIVAVVLFFEGKMVSFVIRNISPKKSIDSLGKSILKTMKELEIINAGAHLVVHSDDLNTSITTTLKNASIHEQNVFNEAIKELLSPIENPMYIIIKKNMFELYDYRYSFACPSIIAKADYGVETLRRHFKAIGKMDVVYAYYDDGKKLSLKCRRKSFITENTKAISKKYKMTKFE